MDKVFLQGATMPPLHQKKFGIVIIVGNGALCLCFDIAKVFLLSATKPHLYSIFSELSLLWEGALCFCYDLAMVFLQGATMPPLYSHIFWNCHNCGKGGIMLLLRLSQGISSGCHHATPTPKHFLLFIIVGRGIMLLLRLSQGISSGCQHATATYHFLFFIIAGRGIILLLRLSQGISSGCHMPPHFSDLSSLREGGIILLRLNQGIYSGCTMPPLQPRNYFWHVISVGKEIEIAGGIMILLRLI